MNYVRKVKRTIKRNSNYLIVYQLYDSSHDILLNNGKVYNSLDDANRAKMLSKREDISIISLLMKLKKFNYYE